MKNKKAFTLVELLVVISIIAILLAILIPSLRRAKEQANSIVCKSNMKNYNLAMVMYLQANREAYPHPIASIDGRNPGGNIPAGTYQKECVWHDNRIEPKGPLWPYLKAKGVNICPTFSLIARNKRKQHEEYLASIGKDINKCRRLPIEPRLSYSMNGFLSGGDELEKLASKEQMPKCTNVKRPAMTLLFTEENIWTITKAKDGVQVSGDAWNDMYFMAQKYGTRDSIATFHKAPDSKLNKGFGDVLFVDGHVEDKKAFDTQDMKNQSSGKSYWMQLGQ
jgi:prepilin-type N-terminal cleavage/methylation domain-containing protein/prepilin-type processing-associated H-X9-DG protein